MYAGLIAALFLLAVLPLFGGGWILPLILVYLMLPAYMLHQVEEHAGDRFRRYVNRQVLKVPDALTTVAVVVINVPLVWGVYLVVLYLARFAGVGWGLVAAYLMLVNAVLHVVAALVRRGYNPGLATAVVVFLPLSIWSLVAISSVPGVTVLQQAVGLAVGVLVHLAIVVHVRRRVAKLRETPAAA
ncbi:MAG: HXXEE domain-containing protein [Rhizobiales bacterium]|nr:HXXEE domain-containing protein [Hyphomicrobiales bacterium]